jgi:hypothetical protein
VQLEKLMTSPGCRKYGISGQLCLAGEKGKKEFKLGRKTTSEGEIPPQDLKGSRIAHGTTM